MHNTSGIRMRQHTLQAPCTFSGKGLHTGKPVTMRVLPAPAGTGIVFCRTDLGPEALVPARVACVTQARRSTTLSQGGVKVVTPEHLLSACYGLGVDNARVDLDAPEVPILDGSAKPYADAFLSCGLAEQDASRDWLVVTKPFVYEDARSDSRITFEPAETPSFEVTVDYHSEVLGVQDARFEAGTDYAREIAPCRTFCFFHEIELLLKLGLIKGGSLDNALVIDEPKGYLGGKTPFFPNEPARHKLLDLLGDFALAGKPILGRVTAWKPGHKVNTQALKQFLETTI